MFSAYHELTRLENRLTSKTNVDAIRVLEGQIKEHQRRISELKRTQNSLLNISRLPPEILGDIFCRSAIPDGFEKRSYNFLLVCHHWFEVASFTPELWGFWGNNPRDWERQHLRYPEVPLDLILDGSRVGDALDDTVHDSLRDRASRDSIRRVHLRARNWKLLNSILSPLTADEWKDVRYNSVESFILRNEGNTPVNVSDFFAYNRSRRLQCLELTNCTITSWDCLTSQTTVLTTLVLHLSRSSPAPTTPQLFSILSSSPALRKITLTGCSVPTDADDDPSPRLPFRHLEELKLAGRVHDVFKLLLRLDHPRHMHHLEIILHQCAVGDISNVVGPYLRDHLRRHGWSQNKLGLHISTDNRIVVRVGNVGSLCPPTPVSERMVPFIVLAIDSVQTPPNNSRERIILDLIAHTPREEIVYLRMHENPTAMENIYARLPILRSLYVGKISLSAVFPKQITGGNRILPFLQHVFLERVDADRGDWTPLTAFLSCRTPLDSLEILNSSYMCPEEVKDVGKAVRHFWTNHKRHHGISPNISHGQ